MNSLNPPIYTKDGFLFFRELNKPEAILGDRLIIEEHKLASTVDYINKNDVKSITVNPFYSKIANLDFLKEVPLVEGLFLLQNDLDLSSISSLSKLRVLRLDDLKRKFDFSAFPDLEVLSYTYSKNALNVGACKKLFWLWIDNYNKENLLEFKDLIALQYMSLFKSGIKNLEGLEGMIAIKEVYLDTMRNLESLRGLHTGLKNLSKFYLYGAKNLNDYYQLGTVKSIKHLELRKTGDTQSISFVNEMPDLEEVVFGFKVLDGNMSYLHKIKKAGFIDFPHYTHKMKDFNTNP